MNIPFIGPDDVAGMLTWTALADALEEAHQSTRADLGDLFLKRGDDTLLNRAAWIDGLGMALKSVSIFPNNGKRQPALPSVHGVVVLFDDETGAVKALIDGPLVTKWKTAADSVLGARLLARPESKRLAIIGSGVVAASLIEAYSETFPALEQISVWSRRHENAERLAHSASVDCQVEAVTDLADAVSQADIVSSATLTKTPIIKGEWVRPGTHVDLIGAFKPDMREADDDLLQKAELFVDARETTIHEIGELMIPIAQGVIAESDIRGDLYDLCNDAQGRSDAKSISVFKNGGGAHLDLMTAHVIYKRWAGS